MGALNRNKPLKVKDHVPLKNEVFFDTSKEFNDQETDQLK